VIYGYWLGVGLLVLKSAALVFEVFSDKRGERISFVPLVDLIVAIVCSVFWLLSEELGVWYLIALWGVAVWYIPAVFVISLLKRRN